MAKKTFKGLVVSDKMQKTVVVKVERQVRHPIYQKTLRKFGRIKADIGTFTPKIGQSVVIEQSAPISRDKNFRVIKVIEEGGNGK